MRQGFIRKPNGCIFLPIQMRHHYVNLFGVHFKNKPSVKTQIIKLAVQMVYLKKICNRHFYLQSNYFLI